MSPHFWRANEKALVTRMYEAGAPLREISDATGVSSDAIRRAVGRWKLHRPAGHIGIETRADLAWPRITAALAHGRALTVAALIAATGLSKQSVLATIARHRSEMHIAGYERTQRKPAALWRLGAGIDAEMLKPKRRTAAVAAIANPFLIAAGHVAPIQTISGRVNRMLDGDREAA